MIRKSIIKIISLLLFVSLNWAGLSAVIDTFAYYNDTETSLENSYSAGTLDFYLTASEWEPEEIASEMVTGD